MGRGLPVDVLHDGIAQADTVPVGQTVANQLPGECHGEIEHDLSTQEVNNG